MQLDKGDPWKREFSILKKKWKTTGMDEGR